MAAPQRSSADDVVCEVVPAERVGAGQMRHAGKSHIPAFRKHLPGDRDDGCSDIGGIGRAAHLIMDHSETIAFRREAENGAHEIRSKGRIDP